jgi:hypothetical protein
LFRKFAKLKLGKASLTCGGARPKQDADLQEVKINKEATNFD